MKRQIVFTAPGEGAADHGQAEVTAGKGSGDLGRWLGQQALCPKGAATKSRPPAPIVLPPPAAGDAEFSRWLTSDLRARGSAGVSRSSTPPDSLAPQVLPELEAPPSMAAADLDAEDLSVLPGRPKAFALLGTREGRRSMAALGVVLFAFGFFLMRGGQTVASAPEPATAAEVPAPGSAAVLLPPPPDDVAAVESEVMPLEEGETTARAREPHAPRAVDAADVAGPTLSELRSRLGGPSVARFPDLPSPKLSELARDGLQEAKEREEAARKAAKKSPFGITP